MPMSNFEVLTAHVTYYRSNGVRTFKNKAYNRAYWEHREIAEVYDWALAVTSFLPEDTSMSVRYYFIEHELQRIPTCPVCNHPINIPTSYYDCLPVTHNTCIRAHVDHKIKQTMNERYGGNPMFDSKVKVKHRLAIGNIDHEAKQAKAWQTQRQSKPTYGDRAAAMRARQLQTNTIWASMQSVGYDHPAQQHIAIQVLMKINNPTWLSTEYQTKSAKQIARETGVNKTAIQNRLHKYNIATIKRYSSDIENEIAAIFEQRSITVVRNLQIPGSKLEVDIYLPEQRVAVEFHGLYWHVEQHTRAKFVHYDKYKLCADAGITLIQVWADEWHHKREIVQSRLLHVTQQASLRIFARKCVVRPISSAETNAFIHKHHVQGSVAASVKLGLFYQDVLVGAMTFGKCRYSTAAEWELLRFCTNGSAIIGGASKLWAHFLSTQSPTSILSYSNNRYGSGKVYKQLGMTLTHESAPSYSYVSMSDCLKTYHRSTFMKHKLSSKLKIFDTTKTEYENMLDNDYDRIWDCGNKVFLWKSPQINT